MTDCVVIAVVVVVVCDATRTGRMPVLRGTELGVEGAAGADLAGVVEVVH